MPAPPDWNPQRILQGLQAVPWSGRAFRVHDRKYPAADPGGSLRVPGRYHIDRPTLYLAVTKAIALGERQRHLDAALLPRLATIRITELAVSLDVVLDCRDPSVLRVQLADLLHDQDFDVPRAIGAAARGLNVEAILVPSATLIDAHAGNLVVFTENLRATSRLEVVRFEDPRLRPV
jgi:hypothetical protein